MYHPLLPTFDDFKLQQSKKREIDEKKKYLEELEGWDQINAQGELIFHKIYHYNLIYRLPPMSIHSKSIRERQGYSPLKERIVSKYTPRALPAQLSPFHQNSTNQYGKTRYQVSNRSVSPNLQLYTATSSSINDRSQRHDSFMRNLQKTKKQHQIFSCCNEIQTNKANKRSILNDFSFQEDFQQSASQTKVGEGKRENIRMRGLEMKMNNIESINEKINNLLQLVKRDKSKDKVQTNKIAMMNTKEICQNEQLKTRALSSSSPNKQKENRYFYQISDKQPQKQKNDKNGLNIDRFQQPSIKTRPLSNLQQNIDRHESKKYQMTDVRHQKSINLPFANEYQEHLYSPPPRNKRRHSNIAYNNGQQGKTLQKILENSQQTEKSNQSNQNNDAKIQWTPQKSIDSLLNERRMLKRKRQSDNTINNCQQNVNTITDRPRKSHNIVDAHTQTLIDPKEIMTDEHTTQIYDRASTNATNNGELNQIRQRIAKLSNSIKYEESDEIKLDDMKANLTGRIYKKTEVTTPTRALFTHKKRLEISIED